jgi:hypothetical protein
MSCCHLRSLGRTELCIISLLILRDETRVVLHNLSRNYLGVSQVGHRIFENVRLQPQHEPPFFTQFNNLFLDFRHVGNHNCLLLIEQTDIILKSCQLLQSIRNFFASNILQRLHVILFG